MNVRDRVKELRRVRAGDLAPHPNNWRTHPDRQKDVLRGVLAEVGYADALIAREMADGSLQLIDGHLRAETTPDALVPVLVTDLTAEEAAKVLATLDPLASLAGVDAANLDALLRDVQTGSEAVAGLLDELAQKAGLVPGAGDEGGPAGVDAIPEKYQILIEFDAETAQAEWLEKLSAEGLNCRSLIS